MSSRAERASQHTPRTVRSALRHTTAGSLGDRIVQLVRRATAAAGGALPMATLRDAFHATRDAAQVSDEVFRAMCYNLLERGILVRASGRSGAGCYAHRDDAASAAPTVVDDVVTILRALERAYTAAGRPVTTREVTAALAGTGPSLQATGLNVVRVRLGTLTRTRRRGDPAWYAPRVVRHTVATVRGRPSARWAPAAAPATSPALTTVTPASDADATRGLVLVVSAALGRPVSRRECAWWCAAHPNEPAAQALAHLPLTRMLAWTSAADRQHPESPSALVRVQTPDSCWGGAQSRFRIAGPRRGAARAVEEAAIRMEDIGLQYWVAEEMSAVRQLASQRALQLLLDARRQALGALLAPLRMVPSVIREEAVRLLERGYTAQSSWCAKTTLSDDTASARRGYIDRARAGVQAVAEAVAHTDGTTRRPRGAGGVLLPALDAFFHGAAVELRDEPAGVRRVCVRDVRRVAMPATSTGIRVHSHRGLVGVDRVDALLRIFRMVPATRTNALLAEAHTLVGHVLRETTPLAVLTVTPGVPRHTVRAAVIAMGLLGEAPGAGLVATLLSGDAADQRALLAAWLVSGAHDQILKESGRSPAWQVAAKRLRSGHVLTAAEL